MSKQICNVADIIYYPFFEDDQYYLIVHHLFDAASAMHVYHCLSLKDGRVHKYGLDQVECKVLA